MNKDCEDTHFDRLHAWRGLLALGIVWHHMGPPEFLFGVPINVPGRVLVWLFYALSGFVIAKSFFDGRYQLNRGSILRFYARRLLRIVPLLYVVYFVLWFLTPRDLVMTPRFFIENLLFLKYSFAYYPVLGAAWFLGPLIQMYIVFPLVYFLLERVGIKTRIGQVLGIVMIVSVILPYASYALNKLLGFTAGQGDITSFDDRTLLGNLNVFLLGAAAVPVLRKWPQVLSRVKVRRLLFWAGCAIVVLLSVLYYRNSRCFWVLPSSTVAGAGGVLLILWCQSSGPWQPSHIGRGPAKVLMMLGTLSYGIFLWHDAWVQTVVNRVFPSCRDSYGSFIIGFVLAGSMTAVTAWLTYRLVETPFSRLRKIF